jgi:hypothetical protein
MKGGDMFKKLSRVLDLLIVNLTLSTKLLRYLVWVLTVRPNNLGKIVQVREVEMAKQIHFEYKVTDLKEPPVGTDKQRLSITVDGVEKEPVVIGSADREMSFVVGPAGAVVDLKFDYIDAAGNDSGDFTTTFVVEDKVAPSAPVDLGVMTQVAEVEVDVPDVEVPPTE